MSITGFPKPTKLQGVLIVTFAILFLTNPGPSTARESLGIGPGSGFRRHLNLFICSIYQRSMLDQDDGPVTKHYIGVLGNVFYLKRSFPARPERPERTERPERPEREERERPERY
jgi:hypothetical protein